MSNQPFVGAERRKLSGSSSLNEEGEEGACRSRSNSPSQDTSPIGNGGGSSDRDSDTFSVACLLSS